MEEKTARRQIPELSGICLYPPAEAGYLCIPPALQLLKELVSSYTPEEENQHQENQEDPTAVVLGVVANLFQKVIELLARRLRKQPEEGKQVFKVYLLAVHWSQTFMMSLLNLNNFFSIASAVSLGCTWADGVPPGRPDMRLSPHHRCLLYPFCCHLSGGQTLASEGRNELHLPHPDSNFQHRCKLPLFEDDTP